MTIKAKTAGPLTTGKEIQVIDTVADAAGTITEIFSIDSESVLLSLYVGTVSGDLEVKAYTEGKDGEMQEVIAFPTISAPTTEILLKKAASVLQRIKVVATYTGACSFNVRARGVGADAASVKILGQNAGKNYATTIGTSPTLIIPIAITDRVGIALHNTHPSLTMYLGFTPGTTTTVDGWEVSPGEKLGLDIASGVSVYGMVLSGTITVKVLEAGN